MLSCNAKIFGSEVLTRVVHYINRQNSVNLFKNVIALRKVRNIVSNNKIMSFLSGMLQGIDCYRCYYTMNIINLRHPRPYQCYLHFGNTT